MLAMKTEIREIDKVLFVTENLVRVCMRCGKENEYSKQCTCGGNGFAFGRGLTIKGDKVHCFCGCSRFILEDSRRSVKSLSHIYKCASCKGLLRMSYCF